MNSSFCGIDFGTSNSTIGIWQNKRCELVTLENNKPTICSAIFCDAENKTWVFGQAGIDRYLNGTPGRLMMALKSVLGSSLMEDKTLIFDQFIPYTKVLSHFMQYLKHAAERHNQALTQVVLGRPVHFHDYDVKKDKLAQTTLEKIAKDIGFKEVSFQLEPIAAALTYELSIDKEQLALIIDMGGGTSDFTIIRLHPGATSADRSADVLANAGIHIAGTDFDQQLSLHTVMPLLGMGSLMTGSSSTIEVPSMYYHDLTTWHTLSHLYDPKTIANVRSIQTRANEKAFIERLINVLKKRAGHRILSAVEKSKQSLSTSDETCIDLEFIEEALNVAVQRLTFNSMIADHLERILATILETVRLAGVKPTDINAIFYTGGSTKVPIVRARINPLFPHAQVVQGDAFGSVGLGLTIDAQRKFS